MGDGEQSVYPAANVAMLVATDRNERSGALADRAATSFKFNVGR